VTGRDRIVIMVVLAVGAVVAGWMFVVSPKRDQASSLSTQITAQQSQLSAAQNQVAAGESAKKAFAGQYAQLAKLGEAVPPDDEIPSLIYQVQSAAQAAHVTFRGLQLSAGSSSSTPSTSTGTTGAAPAAQLPPGAAIGPAGLPTEQFTITLSGNYFHLSSFFNRLESFVVSSNSRLLVSGRLMTINAINLVPGPNGFPQITASVSATTYIVPPTEGSLGGATQAGPAPSTQAQTSTPGSSTAAPAAAVTPVVR
jgi:outer membrane murein-binding lipoprotein Lpp